MADPQVTFSAPETIKPEALEVQRMELGWMGLVFGSSKVAPTSICGLVVVLMVVAGIVLLFWQGTIKADEYWKMITPFLTLVFGFLFGRNSSS